MDSHAPTVATLIEEVVSAEPTTTTTPVESAASAEAEPSLEAAIAAATAAAPVAAAAAPAVDAVAAAAVAAAAAAATPAADVAAAQPEVEHCVVLVQRLAPEVSVEDIIHHARSVGTVTGRFVQEKTRHAFIEMATQVEAKALVERLSAISIKGHQLKAELSSRYARVTQEQVNKVLVLSLPGLVDGQTDCYQLTTLLKSKGGDVKRIQLWTTKEGIVQGLVEMDSNESAKVLREQLSGYMMGTATVRMSYSNKPGVEIKQSQYGYDFVTKEGNGMCPRVGPQGSHHHHHDNRNGGGNSGRADNGNGNGFGHGNGRQGGHQNASHHNNNHGHGAHGSHGNHGNHGHGGHGPHFPHNQQGGQQHLALNGHFAHMAHPGMHPEELGVITVLVKNLIEGTTPEAIFRLFGVCGDVRAVKIMYKKRSTALVQYDTPRGAMKAIQLLNGCPFYEENRTLEVLLSEVGQVKGVPDELTKYFSESAHHRFSGKSALKNLENMYGPNQQLHISNVPIGVPDETVDDALRNYGDSVQTRWIGNKANSEVRTKMCIANMDSVRSAVSALIGLHTIFFAGHEPANRKGIVVSFSKRMPQRNPEPRGEGHGRNGGLIPDPTRSYTPTNTALYP